MSGKRSFWKSFSIRSLLLLTTLACCFVAWRVHRYERGTVNEWIDAVLQDVEANPQAYNSWGKLAIIPCPRELSSSSKIRLLMKAIHWLPTSERRNCALKIIAEQFPAETHDLCLEICRTTDDDSLRRNAILIAGLFRMERDIERFERYLDDPNPEIRSAAIDAICIIHKPSFPLPAGIDNIAGQVVLQSVPPISLVSIRTLLSDVDAGQPVTNQFDWKEKQDRHITPKLKNKIENLWLVDSDSEVRSAAARFVRNWVPEEYRLRVAEWGVWINQGEDLVLAQSIIDEIPPFVHRVGNDQNSINVDRSKSMIIVTKPIIHFSVDQPLVIDLSVRIAEGRPWFGFPMPDDFSVTGSGNRGVFPFAADPETFEELNLEPLDDLREGYPWIAPCHSMHYALVFADVGLRWQTLFVSPERLDWMELKPVTDETYRWWERLRAVDCSWVSNRGESERFVYYDGPTRLASPVVVSHESGEIEVVSPSERMIRAEPPFPLQRMMVLIDVVDGHASASKQTHGFLPDDSSFTISDSELPIKGEEVEKALLDSLMEFGLNRDEAMGLIDCWRPQFLEKDGLRLLTVFGGREYDLLCPMDIQPTPTELCRVGIVLTELGGGPSN